MKVDGPNKSSGTKGVSKSGAKQGASGAGFSGLIEDTEETASSAATGGSMTIQGIDALLSLQEAGDATTSGNKKGKRRGEELLNQLDQVRIGLLTGGIPLEALQQLDKMIHVHREQNMDPRLAEVLEEIDLRVQVELAKHYQR